MTIRILSLKFAVVLAVTKQHYSAGDLFRMYTKYAESQGWRCEIIDANEPELGGFKRGCFSL